MNGASRVFFIIKVEVHHQPITYCISSWNSVQRVINRDGFTKSFHFRVPVSRGIWESLLLPSLTPSLLFAEFRPRCHFQYPLKRCLRLHFTRSRHIRHCFTLDPPFTPIVKSVSFSIFCSTTLSVFYCLTSTCVTVSFASELRGCCLRGVLRCPTSIWVPFHHDFDWLESHSFCYYLDFMLLDPVSPILFFCMLEKSLMTSPG